jgi:hypothetical protein
MKNNMVFIVSFFTLFAQAMEQEDMWGITIGKTKINFNTGFISDVANKVDAILLGLNQQLGCFDCAVGELYQKKSIVFEDKRDNYSYDDSYEIYVYTWDEVTNIRKTIMKRTVDCSVFNIVEPRIKSYAQFPYSVDRPVDEKKHRWINYHFGAHNAIKEASKDLANCYTLALDGVLKKLADKAEKSIAVATLSVDIGFPREDAALIAVSAIFEYVQKNPDAYDRMELFVSTRSEFMWYKLLFMKHCGLTQNVSLLYLAKDKDQDSALVRLPRELIDYIAKLI